MNSTIATGKEKCSREKIAAYLDGALESGDELCLERHVAVCPECLAELNLQKRLFSALDSEFGEKTEIKLPENFAKIVAVRAETNVKGVRSRKERRRALLLCAGLFLLVVAGLGMRAVANSLGQFGERLMAVASFAGHLIYDLGIGLTVILRAIGSQPNVASTMLLFLLIGIFVLPAVFLSRYLDNSNRF